MDKKLMFQKLTPLADTDISTYEEAIDYAFQNDDIKNVAISGSYGAGKSSVLESYKAKRKGYNFVHISLAHFHDPEQESDTSNEEVNEAVLEGKILNQLIHQIATEKIPQTNFKVKRKVDGGQSRRLTMFIGSLMVGIVYLLSFSHASVFVSSLEENWAKSLLLAIYDPYMAVFTVLIVAALGMKAIYMLIQAQKNKNILHKVSLQGNEIELFANQDDSFFDKYLNEVLYLFDNVDADVVVFEDMDRFNANQIFERLREVNTLINGQRKKEQGEKYKPLRFFYLLRDDIFESKDRTKFFDYIVPIVPIVDGSNSYEKFAELLREAGLIKQFDSSFLQSLCLYIDDMRVLKNVYNEFVVYYNRLNNTELNCNKMMAIIVYKNLFPRDHSELQLGRGFVAELFAQKDFLNHTTIQGLEAKKQALLDRIEQAQKECFESDDELEYYYKCKIEELEGPYRNRYVIPDTVQDGVRQLKDKRAKRKQALEDRCAENREKIETEITKIEREIDAVKSKRLKDLITRENIDGFFAITHKNEIGVIQEFEDIKSSDYFNLLKFLIRNGYIDETYPDYMTYFYEGNITQNDKIFLRRITDRRGAAYDYALREPEKVIQSRVLREAEFEQEETLNYDLLDCLLLNSDNPLYRKYLSVLMRQIRETKNFDFVSKFYNTGRSCAELVVWLNQQWTSFFEVANPKGGLPSAQLRKFSIDTLYYCDNDLIQRVNIEGCLTTYISESPDFLEIESPNIERLISGFSLLKVSFSRIDYDRADKGLFDAVYQNGLYQLSFENIDLMLRKVYKIEDEHSIAHKNYTMIQQNPTSPLAQYVAANLSAYMQTVLEHCDGIITDEETHAIALLNSADLDTQAKTQYITVLTTRITKISEVTDNTLWPSLMNRGIVTASVENLVRYFSEHGMDLHLVDYINALPMWLDYSTVENVFGKEVTEKLHTAVAECNDIADEKYRGILVGLGYHFNNFSKENLEDEKLEILIQQKLLRMNEDNLNFIRENYKNHLLLFIKENLDEYLKLQNEDIFNLEEAEVVIGWEFEDTKKIALLELTNEPISVVGQSYTDSVVAHILENNYDSEDMQELCAKYSHYGDTARKVIVTLAEQEIDEILGNEFRVDDALLSALFTSNYITENAKICLFSNALSVLNEETCMRHFEELGISELSGIFNKSGGRRNYPKTDLVEGILESLKKHTWIYAYKEDERNPDRYIVIKNQPKNVID